jgi:hypothetical protein
MSIAVMLSWLILPGRLAGYFAAIFLCLHSRFCFSFQQQALCTRTDGDIGPKFGSFLRTTESITLAATTSSRQESLETLKARSSPTVKVNVYVESLCIDSKVYFDKQLMPTYETLGPAVMDLRVVVFGNAHIEANSTSIQCQHGEGMFLSFGDTEQPIELSLDWVRRFCLSSFMPCRIALDTPRPHSRM